MIIDSDFFYSNWYCIKINLFKKKVIMIYLKIMKKIISIRSSSTFFFAMSRLLGLTFSIWFHSICVSFQIILLTLFIDKKNIKIWLGVCVKYFYTVNIQILNWINIRLYFTIENNTLFFSFVVASTSHSMTMFLSWECI